MSDDDSNYGDWFVEVANSRFERRERRTGERLVGTVQLPVGAAEFLARVGE